MLITYAPLISTRYVCVVVRRAGERGEILSAGAGAIRRAWVSPLPYAGRYPSANGRLLKRRDVCVKRVTLLRALQRRPLLQPHRMGPVPQSARSAERGCSPWGGEA